MNFSINFKTLPYELILRPSSRSYYYIEVYGTYSNEFIFGEYNISKYGFHCLFSPTDPGPGAWPITPDIEGLCRMATSLVKIVDNKLYKSPFLLTFIKMCSYDNRNM